MKEKWKNQVQAVKDGMTYAATFKKTFFTLFVIYIIGILAIVRANYYYCDDLGRANWGYRNWIWSRHISNYLSILIHGDTHMTDISPLTQILSMALIAITAIILLRTVTGKDKFSIGQTVAMIPLGLSPYFLECISYKFDCIYMAISVLVMFLPVLFAKKKMILYLIVVFLSSLVMCMTYQASAGIFPMFVILVCLNRWFEKEKMSEIMKFAFASAIPYLAGILFFRKCLMVWRVDYTSPAMPSADNMLQQVLTNYRTYFGHIVTDFKAEWLVLIGIIGVAFVVASILKSQRNKVLAALLSLAVLAAMLLLSFGVYPLLENPIYAPRAMYGSCVLVTLLIAQIVSVPKMYLSKAVCWLLCWLFFSFAFTYGNALYMQATYADFRIMEVIDDIKDIDEIQDSEQLAVQVHGTIGYAPSIEKMPTDYQMLRRLVPVGFWGPDSTWGQFGLLNYYGLDAAPYSYVDLKTLDLPLVEETVYHTIYADEKHVLIELK